MTSLLSNHLHNHKRNPKVSTEHLVDEIHVDVEVARVRDARAHVEHRLLRIPLSVLLLGEARERNPTTGTSIHPILRPPPRCLEPLRPSRPLRQICEDRTRTRNLSQNIRDLLAKPQLSTRECSPPVENGRKCS